MFQLDHSERESLEAKAKELKGAYDRFRANTVTGFHRISEHQSLWQESKERGAEVRVSAEHLVVVGIGGSSLGSRAIYQALEDRSDREISFLDNVDGWEFSRFCQKLKNLHQVHWVLISKSGGTLETLALTAHIEQFLNRHGIALKDHSTVISEKKSSVLVDWAESSKIPVLTIPQNVGGRFSVFTPVGLFPAAFLGLDLDAFQRGVEEALDDEKRVTELAAFALQGFSEERWVTAFWVYCSRLTEFSRWQQQLWAESLAKRQNRLGDRAPQVSVPLPLLGSTDQHSVLQQMVEGHEKKSVWFFRVTESEDFGESIDEPHFADALALLRKKPLGALLGAFGQSTRESLSQQNVPSIEIKMERLNERELGSLMMTMMLVIGVLGECLDINAFDQPGVELGKKLVKNYLSDK